MLPIKVTYMGTEHKISEDINALGESTNAKHYLYFYPDLEYSGEESTASFNIEIVSQFEAWTNIQFCFSTLSKFVFERFSLQEDNYEVLDDYSQIAYRHHLVRLKEKLADHPILFKVNSNAIPFIRDSRVLNSLESVLYRALLDSDQVPN